MLSAVRRGWETSSSTMMEPQERPHLNNNIKEDHVYGMMVSKILDIRWGQECLRQGETKWAFRFLQLTAWRHERDPGEPRRLAVEDWIWEGDRGVWSSQHRWPEKRELHGESPGHVQSGPSAHSVVRTCATGNCLRLGKKPRKGSGATAPNARRTGSSCLHQADWKTSWLTHTGESTQYLSQEWGIISTQLNGALLLP